MSSVDGANNRDNKQDDFWGQSQDALSHTNRPVNILRKKSEPVKDDWDDEDEEEVDEETLWREANTKAPMPEVIIARPSTASTMGTVVPPPEAFHAPVRILKRPKPASGASQSTSNAASLQKSLSDREAAYQAARERIFGSSNPGSSPGTPSDERPEDLSASLAKLELASQSQRQSQDKTRSSSRSISSEAIGRPPSSDQSGVSVIRNPRGPPTSNASSTPRGFGGRRGGKRGSGSKENAPYQTTSAQIPSSSTSSA